VEIERTKFEVLLVPARNGGRRGLKRDFWWPIRNIFFIDGKGVSDYGGGFVSSGQDHSHSVVCGSGNRICNFLKDPLPAKVAKHEGVLVVGRYSKDGGGRFLISTHILALGDLLFLLEREFRLEGSIIHLRHMAEPQALPTSQKEGIGIRGLWLFCYKAHFGSGEGHLLGFLRAEDEEIFVSRGPSRGA